MRKKVVTDRFHAVLYRVQVVIPILQFVIENTSRCPFRGCYLEINVVMNKNQAFLFFISGSLWSNASRYVYAQLLIRVIKLFNPTAIKTASIFYWCSSCFFPALNKPHIDLNLTTTVRKIFRTKFFLHATIVSVIKTRHTMIIRKGFIYITKILTKQHDFFHNKMQIDD